MNRASRITVLGIVVLAFGCGGCGGSAKRLNGGGSTFVYPMMSKWASEYEKAKGVQVNYQSIGSGGGIQQMTAKTFDFGCTDGPMNEEQLQKARDVGGDVIHVPLVMGAVVPAYNLDEVKEPLTFSGPVLADVYLGKIKRWNDKAIQDLNPGVKLPDKDIGVVHRSDGSGTTYVWVDYLAKVSPDEWKKKVGVGTSVDWPCGEGAKGNEGVSGRVKATPGAIGYIELIYALQNNIKFGAVQNKEKVAVKADLKSITAAGDNALTDIPEDLRYSITDAGGFALGVMMLPVIVRASEGALKLVPESLRHASHALGASQWQTVVRVTVPAALPAIITAVFLGIARVAGETAPLLLTASSNDYWPRSVNDFTPSLPVYIFNYAVSPYDDWHRKAWAAAFVLMVIVLLLNFGVRQAAGKRVVLASHAD